MRIPYTYPVVLRRCGVSGRVLLVEGHGHEVGIHLLLGEQLGRSGRTLLLLLLLVCRSRGSRRGHVSRRVRVRVRGLPRCTPLPTESLRIARIERFPWRGLGQMRS